MQRDARPDLVRRLAGDAVFTQEATSLVGGVNLEALVGSAVLVREPEIVEHRPDVQQLGIALKPLLLAAQ